MNTFTIAKKGVRRGLGKKEAIVDQSCSVRAPSPSPLIPDPSCWAVTDLGKAQHTQAMLCNVWNK